MPRTLPSLSTDQIAAFVELSRQGSLRAAAIELHLTEQGLRNRLLALEERLAVELYHKARGPKRGQVLTEQGRLFLPHAIAFLVGSDLGLGAAVLERASHHLSLGSLTLAHETARLVLYEQLYRAFAIEHGIKYHRAPF